MTAICGLLLLAVGLVFGQTMHHSFCNLDDTGNVYLNPHVTGGLTAEAVKWAFTERYMGVWLPVTWISHMLDWQLYGHNAGGHHLTNVLLHAATAVLLFLVLRRMTGRLWPEHLVAAVFALHPLRVESVAWVTERKDVLSGLFFVLALGAYVGYVRHRFSIVRYAAVIVLFALGLMAKPMLVTLPFVLLLLDYWPLGRWTVPASQDRSPEGKRIATTASEPTAEEGFRQAAAGTTIASLGCRATASGEGSAAGADRLFLPGVHLGLRQRGSPPARSAFCPAVEDWKRAPFVCELSGHVLLSGEFSNALSPSRSRFAAGEDCRSRRPAGRPHGGSRRGAAGGVPLPAGRLAMVLGNAGAGDRVRPVRNADHGRSLYVLAADRAVPSPWHGHWPTDVCVLAARRRLCSVAAALLLAVLTGSALGGKRLFGTTT